MGKLFLFFFFFQLGLTLVVSEGVGWVDLRVAGHESGCVELGTKNTPEASLVREGVWKVVWL